MEFFERIRHRRARALLSSYIDGEVSAAEARRVEEHAAGCSVCRDEIESLRTTVDLVRALPELEPPRSFELTRLPDEEPGAAFGVWAPRLATSVAGLLLVALLAGDFTGALTQTGGFDEEAAPESAMTQVFEAPAAAAPQAEAPAQMSRLTSADEEAATPDQESESAESTSEAPEQAMKAAAPRAAVGDAQAQESADPPPAPEEDDIVAPGISEPSDAEGGLVVPLRELQVAAAVCFVALAAITVWLARRRRVR